MAFGIDDAIGAGLQIINKFIPDTNARAAATEAYKEAMLQANNQAMQNQADIDKAEAANVSIFVAGWRPFVGWVCGMAFAWNFIGAPMVGYIGALLLKPVPVPSLDLGPLLTVLVGMLGMGGLRTFEKIQGVHGKH